MRGYNALVSKSRPTHGCYDCRRSVWHGVRDGMRRIHSQLGCEPYPEMEVEVYECEKCCGLWLRTIQTGCIMNLREEDARKFFLSLSL